MTDGAALRIGTRGSPLARIQAGAVRDALIAAHPELAGRIAIAVVRTSGDRFRDRALAEIGGKGLFTKEIDEALLDGRIDLAVHSMKDVPTWLPDGVIVPCLLRREDPRDALLGAATIEALGEGAVVGSASVRRRAQLLARRPDLKVVLLRGNVETRLKKLAAGEVDATLLAMAGLKRLGIAGECGAVALAPEVLLPAAGQGAVGVACRADDGGAHRWLAAVHHPPTATAIAAERTFLAALDGSCRTPIAAFAERAGGRVRLRGLLADPEGRWVERIERTGPAAEAAALGTAAGETVRARVDPGFFEEVG